MDRRDFLRTALASSFLPKLLSAAPRSLTLCVLSEGPHLVLPSLLHRLPFNPPSRPSFAFLNAHPHAFSLKKTLSRQGWLLRRDPARADVVLSFLSLSKASPSSFTLIQDGLIRDIRSPGLLSLWKNMQASGPSSLLTTVSFSCPAPDSPAPSLAVFHHGRQVARVPLSKNLTRSFESARGAVMVRVERDRAWVREASCAHQICRHSPPVARPGERIVCAPNRLLIAVVAPHGVDTSIG